MQMQIIIDHFLTTENPIPYKLNADDRILLTILASQCGNKKECWPGYRKLVKNTGIASYSTLNNSINKLESLNIIQVERHYKKNNKYTFVDNFINWVLQNCSRVLHKRSRGATDMYRNNIINNINNNKQSYLQIKKWKGLSKSGTKASPLLEETMNKKIKDKL